MKKVLAAACLLAFSTAHAAQEPEVVFNRACTMCHSGLLPMAPKKVIKRLGSPVWSKAPKYWSNT